MSNFTNSHHIHSIQAQERKAVEAAIASERERCAVIADKYRRGSGSVNGQEAAAEIARQIRGAYQQTVREGK